MLFKKLAASGSAIASVEMINHLFDYVVFPAVVLYFGVVRGWVIMTILAMTLNYTLVRFYARSRHDWYGFELLRLQSEKQANNWKGALIRYGRVPAFIFLSWEDPFKAFILVRNKKATGYWFDKLDWLTFFGANIIGTLIWTGMLGAGIEIVKRVIFG